MKTEPDAWKILIKNSIKDLNELSKEIELTEEEKIEKDLIFKLRITPYYLDLIKKYPILRKTVIPTVNEFKISDDENIDPLAEDRYKKSKCIIHKYYDRCLFLVSNFCATNCRYCTRSRIFDNSVYSKEDIDDGLEYIRNHSELRDIIVSGGDPLTLSDENLEYILKNLREINHVEIIRIGTKIPVVLPSRITENLTSILKKYHPLYMSIHFTHILEITDECREACEKLANAGIVLRSQTVLLKDVNDTAEIMKKLMHKLLTIRVTPYYIYYPDYIIGSNHFRPSIDKGVEIIKELRKSSGYCVPNLVVDSKYSKIIVTPENIIENTAEFIKLESNNGEILELKKIIK